MRLLSIVSAAAIAVAALAATSDAFAQRGRNNQSTSAVVINYQRVLTESAIGRDLAAKLQQVRTQIGTEAQALGPEGQSIEQERQRIANATRNMTAEQLRNSATYAPQLESLSQRLQQFQARQQELQGGFECTQIISLRDVERQVSPVVRSVMESRGAGIVIDASNVNQSSPEFDITNTVIQQLDANQATRTANVTRRQLSECQAQQPAAPPAQ